MFISKQLMAFWFLRRSSHSILPLTFPEISIVKISDHHDSVDTSLDRAGISYVSSVRLSCGFHTNAMWKTKAGCHAEVQNATSPPFMLSIRCCLSASLQALFQLNTNAGCLDVQFQNFQIVQEVVFSRIVINCTL